MQKREKLNNYIVKGTIFHKKKKMQKYKNAKKTYEPHIMRCIYGVLSNVSHIFR